MIYLLLKFDFLYLCNFSFIWLNIYRVDLSYNYALLFVAKPFKIVNFDWFYFSFCWYDSNVFNFDAFDKFINFDWFVVEAEFFNNDEDKFEFVEYILTNSTTFCLTGTHITVDKELVNLPTNVLSWLNYYWRCLAYIIWDLIVGRDGNKLGCLFIFV